MAEASEEFDFLGNSSMKDLAMRMNEIDKEIEAIAEVDKGTPRKAERMPGSPAKNYYETPDDAAAAIEDVVIDDDGDDDDDFDADAGLEDMQKEMKEFEAQQVQQEQAPTAKPFVSETISASCIKPSQSSAIGISMKTSKGVTLILAVNPKGLLAKSSLRPGMQLLQVNGVNIKNAKYAKSIIDSHHGTITLVAKTVPPE